MNNHNSAPESVQSIFDKPILKQNKAVTKELTSTTTRQFLAALKTPNPKVLRYQKERNKFVAEGMSGKELKKATKGTKEAIPCVAFSGVQIQGGKREVKDYDPQSSTGIFLIDIDELEDASHVGEVREICEDVPSCLFAFNSPSGNGIKAGFNVGEVKSDDEFKALFLKFEYFFKDKHHITIDNSCKDIFRLCFLSYDPNVYINEDAEEMDIANMDDAPANVQCFAPIESDTRLVTAFPALTAADVQSMLAFVPYTDYERWMQVGMGLKAWNESEGLALFEAWSKGEPEKWKAGECAKKWARYNRHGTTLATVRAIAQANGWVKESDKTEDDAIVEGINKRYAIVVIGSKTAIAMEKDDGDYSFLTEQGFNLLLKNKFKTVFYGEGKPKEIPHSSVWLKSAKRREYSQGIEFHPMVKVSDRKNGKLNLWNGFAYTPIKHDMERIKPLLDYIKDVACSGNEEYYRYLIRWIARGFQRPHKQAEVAVILRGLKGSGKSTLGKMLAPLWGHHAVMLSDAKHLAGNFNAQLDNCCFLAGEEAIYHGDKKGEGRLKALITEPTLTIEKKGIDAIQVNNCLKIVLAANSEWVIPTSKDERRFFCLNVVDTFETRSKYTDFYNKVYAIVGDDDESRDEEVLAMLLDYLLSYDITGFNHRSYPETEENRQQRSQSLDLIPQFLIESCEKGYFFNDSVIRSKTKGEWEESIHTDALKLALDEWGKTNNKTNYDRVSNLALKNYLGKTLKLSNKSSRDTVAYRNEAFSRIHTRGWQLGSAKDLLLKVVTTEQLSYSDYFGDEEVTDNSDIDF